mmetsp:Transcript_4953/g.10562  ORF Transcript_4953/g.10562 Transcript_4953/m.10562 type:complete len:515 (+) Transcript_4953:6031-7575(+)
MAAEANRTVLPLPGNVCSDHGNGEVGLGFERSDDESDIPPPFMGRSSEESVETRSKSSNAEAPLSPVTMHSDSFTSSSRQKPVETHATRESDAPSPPPSALKEHRPYSTYKKESFVPASGDIVLSGGRDMSTGLQTAQAAPLSSSLFSSFFPVTNAAVPLSSRLGFSSTQSNHPFFGTLRSPSTNPAIQFRLKAQVETNTMNTIANESVNLCSFKLLIRYCFEKQGIFRRLMHQLWMDILRQKCSSKDLQARTRDHCRRHPFYLVSDVWTELYKCGILVHRSVFDNYHHPRLFLHTLTNQKEIEHTIYDWKMQDPGKSHQFSVVIQDLFSVASRDEKFRMHLIHYFVEAESNFKEWFVQWLPFDMELEMLWVIEVTRRGSQVKTLHSRIHIILQNTPSSFYHTRGLEQLQKQGKLGDMLCDLFQRQHRCYLNPMFDQCRADSSLRLQNKGFSWTHMRDLCYGNPHLKKDPIAFAEAERCYTYMELVRNEDGGPFKEAGRKRSKESSKKKKRRKN